jgi:hypothetical protein
MTWSEILYTGTAPNVRGGHTTCCFDGRLFVFGGGSGSSYSNDLHVFNIGKLRTLHFLNFSDRVAALSWLFSFELQMFETFFRGGCRIALAYICATANQRRINGKRYRWRALHRHLVRGILRRLFDTICSFCLAATICACTTTFTHSMQV